jgi:hypothetical protein
MPSEAIIKVCPTMKLQYQKIFAALIPRLNPEYWALPNEPIDAAIVTEQGSSLREEFQLGYDLTILAIKT